jgi:hypothetical protein
VGTGGPATLAVMDRLREPQSKIATTAITDLAPRLVGFWRDDGAKVPATQSRKGIIFYAASTLVETLQSILRVQAKQVTAPGFMIVHLSSPTNRRLHS